MEEKHLRISTQNQEELSVQEYIPLILNNVQDVISITNPDGRIEYFSPSVYKVLGYQQDELIGTLAKDTFHPEDLINLTNSNLLQHTDADVFRCRVKHKDGQYVWFETTVTRVRDEKGNLLKKIGVGRDISDRVKAEEEVRKTKERLESVIQNNADAIWMTDMEDTVLEVNPSFETMFGWTARDVLGQKLPIIPDSLKKVMEQTHQRIKKGESLVGLETIRRRKDGDLMEVEITLSPIRDFNGTVIGITGICRDISRRKRAEEELKAKTIFLESFIENNGDAILLFDHKGVVQKVNKTFESIFGWLQDEVLGVGLYDLPHIPEEYVEESIRWGEQVKQGRPIFAKETIRKHKSGNALNVVFSASPIFDGKGAGNGWAVTIRDITEWKVAQEHLQNSEKLSVAGQLAAGIAHEIRNPLTSIKGFMTLMKPVFQERMQYHDIITSEIERIESILNELLILAKPQPMKCERKDIRVLISQVITLLDSQAILHNVQFVTEFKGGVADVSCDENQLKQVFINFIKNAMEAMPNGGNITIQVIRSKDNQMRIRIKDQGCGIPADVLTKIGQPFYTTKEKGTGLGFMISKKIIENHSGSIHIESEVGKGTVIEITFPSFDN